MSARSLPPLSFFARLGLALAVLFDGLFAARVRVLREAGPEALLPPKAEEKPRKQPVKRVEAAPPLTATPPDPRREGALREEGALLLLQALQRDGRLVDFLEEDVATFDDAQVGAAARVVHDGCRKAIRAHVDLAAIRSEDEGAEVTIAEGFEPDEIKLTGAVSGGAPFRGKLAHRGWRATAVRLPTLVGAADPSVLAAAEVEL